MNNAAPPQIHGSQRSKVTRVVTAFVCGLNVSSKSLTGRLSIETTQTGLPVLRPFASQRSGNSAEEFCGAESDIPTLTYSDLWRSVDASSRQYNMLCRANGAMRRPTQSTAGYLLAMSFCIFIPLASQAQPVASFYYDERGNVIRQEQDTNGDGRMDRWTYYNAQGQTLRVEQDINFDGKPDIINYFEAGKPVRQESASKNDGQIDTWLFFDAKGEIERKGQDPNRIGQPTLWLYYQNGQAVRSEEDNQSNGKSRRVVYFTDGKISRIEEDTSGYGNPNSFSYFDNGQLARVELDRKNSGKIDLWGYYQAGRLVK